MHKVPWPKGYRFLLACCCLALVACGGGGSGSGSGGAVHAADQGNATGAGTADNSQDSDGADDSGEDVDSDNFRIVSHSPAIDAVRRSLKTEIVLQFNKALIAQTVDEATVVVTRKEHPVAVSVRYLEGESQLTISFPQLLLPDTTYRVSVSERLMSVDGDSLTSTQWQFRTAGNIGATPQDTIDTCMSDADIALLAAVNAARAEARQCGHSPFSATAPVAWQCRLEAAARGHSEDMAEHGFFSHTGSDGANPGQRIAASAYDWKTYAENIASGFQDGAAVTEAWLDSPGHCSNIMNPRVTEVGAADARGPYSQYWTQVFAAPR